MVPRNPRRARKYYAPKPSASDAPKSSRKIIHQIQDGRRLRPMAHPPEFVSLPWFQLTVRMENLSVNNTVGTVATALQTQLGLQRVPATQPAGSFQFRLHSIRVWGPLVAMNATTSLSPLTVSFYNVSFQPKLVGSTTIVLQDNILESFTDYPDQVSRASVGFEYPVAQQAVSLGVEANPGPGATRDPILFQLSQGAGVGSVAYVRLLWRPSAPPTNPVADFGDGVVVDKRSIFGYSLS